MDIDYLDCLVLHRPDVLMDLEVIKQAFDVLQATGKVRFFGVSNFNPAQFKMLQNAVSQPLMFDQVQFGLMHTGMIDFGLHTNMTDDASINHDGSLLEFLRMNHITLQAWSPFQYGTFEGTFINNPVFPELHKKLHEIRDTYGRRYKCPRRILDPSTGRPGPPPYRTLRPTVSLIDSATVP